MSENEPTEHIAGAFGDRPEPKIVTLNGRSITIRPIGVGRIPQMAAIIRGCLPDLLAVANKIDADHRLVKELLGEGRDIDPSQIPDPREYVNDALGLLVNHGDDVFRLVELAAGLPKRMDGPDERIDYDQVDLEEFTEVVLAVVETNLDFFIRRLLPMVMRMLEETQARMAEVGGAGSIPSSASSAPDTGSTTSAATRSDKSTPSSEPSAGPKSATP